MYCLKKVELNRACQCFMVFCKHRDNESFCGLEKVHIGNNGYNSFEASDLLQMSPGEPGDTNMHGKKGCEH